MYHNKSLANILTEMFGFPRKSSPNIIEVEHNCPKCDTGRNKFNLAINLEKKVFQCWACGYRGRIRKLIYDYGSVYHQERYKQIVQFSSRSRLLERDLTVTIDEEKLSLGSFKSLKVKWKESLHYRAAINYLKSRCVTEDMINDWDICYAEEGKYKNRIIIPSKTITGKIEYFIARAFYDATLPKYKNPRVPKDEIIFGEKFIDWKKPVIITEGIFDSMVVYNSVPVMGTNLKNNKKLLKKLIRNETIIYLAFDKDAIKKVRIAAKYLSSFGLGVYIIKHKEYNDLAEAFQKSGKQHIINLLREAQPFDELDLAILELE
jgi:DNA primase